MSESVTDRVRRVMEAASLSQAAFAERVGLTPDKLSKSLSGVRRFTALDLALIAETGGRTVEWLLTGRKPLRPSVAARTRGFAAPDRTNIEETTHRFTTAYDVLDLLGRSAELPVLPEVRAHVQRHTEQGTLLAEDALARLASAGIPSVAALETEELIAACEQHFGVDVAITALPRGVDGLTWQTDGFRLVLLRRTDTWTRQRFTLAHELGHILARDAQELLAENSVAPGRQQDPTEVRANVFAAKLLMPEQEVRAAFGEGAPEGGAPLTDEVFKKLVVRFRVSPSALAARLHQLGFVEPEKRARLRGLTTETCHLSAGAVDAFQRQMSLAEAERLPPRLLSALFRGYLDGETTLRPLAALMGVDVDRLHDHLDPVVQDLPAQGFEEGDLVFQP
ncbi:XRE family transcriptional regulator [Streptomyces albus]|uniref:XRE family transcriptional regulator n=1 Tax=Streptomyces albus TaxID=1888 RepID=UPI0004C8F26E|nr:XRE family transcriptional regulator [Streptomyces albus]